MLELRNPGRRRGGRAAVEAALVLPVCLLFLFGIFEYGRYVLTLQVFTNAAREGARYALTHVQPVVLGGVTYGNATSDVTNTVGGILGGQQLSAQSIQVFASDSQGNNVGPWTNAQAGQSVCVQITGNYIPAVSRYLYLPTSIPVRIKSVMRVESS